MQWLVIGVSGVTCGGKTTLSSKLRDYFQSQKNAQLWNTPYTMGEVELLSQDDYFLPVDDLRHKWNMQLNVINFEVLCSLDMKQMMADIKAIMLGQGKSIARHNNSNGNSSPANSGDHILDNIEYINEMAMSTNFQHYSASVGSPTYSSTHQQQQQHQHPHQHKFQPHNHHQAYAGGRHSSLASGHNIMRINSQVSAASRDNKINILLIEGFMIFNQPELLTLCNIKFHLHLPYEKCYERRQLRTYDPPDIMGYFEVCVWPHYEKNFTEFRDRKDITFLNGELSKDRIFQFVLKRIGTYFEERCDVGSCPPPHKMLGIPSNCANTSSSIHSPNSANKSNGSVGGGVVAGTAILVPMEQQ